MNTKKFLHNLISTASTEPGAAESGHTQPLETYQPSKWRRPKHAEHGDLATNLALVLAKQAKLPPRKVAQAIIDHLRPRRACSQKVEMAGPGFINFFIADAYWHRVIAEIHRLGPAYGNSDMGAGVKVQVEFVSANPTGPLHIGHGRGAALGDALANLLAATGHTVEREYYINDVGNQILTLGKSLYFRLRELGGEAVVFPEDGYQGDYMKELAQKYLDQGRPVPPAGAPRRRPAGPGPLRRGHHPGRNQAGLEGLRGRLRPLVQRNRSLPPGPGGPELYGS